MQQNFKLLACILFSHAIQMQLAPEAKSLNKKQYINNYYIIF